MTTTKKTDAVVIVYGRAVAHCQTSLPGGSVVNYGDDLGDCIHSWGTGKISRAKKYVHLGLELPSLAVNQGGGPAV